MTTTSRPKKQESTEIGQEVMPGMRLRAICRGHTSRIGRIAWSPCSRFIASPSRDETIRVWDVESGECLAVLRGHNDLVLCVAWSAHGGWLVGLGCIPKK
uniref:WD domain-containing protein, G-beta repeat-containing protein n=1 Tax=Candidatus Kentrum sp. FM TaxID=2126340 RepID=A0A450TCY7_9GAMM|nr:MAG: WD domain-containing protein, G-beta repeat-containing protein [Candidatus Kentron sp. FM]VFJ64831.1 MAG: WD domain-containing protein, G-beta repeat-containing protein [Candidatus Kentron sp. FM]VFK15321.1 MAG: WD domain-containing protein, G-beta repeat-containing protein [Candidatus Kentron sp. FM]